MPKSRRNQVTKLRARLAESEKKAAESEKKAAEALAVLGDLAEERGLPPWLCAVIDRRDKLMRMLRLLIQTRRPDYDAPYSGDFPYGNAADGCAELLRIIGGPEETQRQVDEAWDVALEEARYRDDDETRWQQMDEARQAHAGETHSERCWASLAWGHGECVCGGQACEHRYITPNFTVDGETGATREVAWGCTACGARVDGPALGPILGEAAAGRLDLVIESRTGEPVPAVAAHEATFDLPGETRGYRMVPRSGRALGQLEGLASGERRFESPEEMLERASSEARDDKKGE